jgi:hypothetical protein
VTKTLTAAKLVAMAREDCKKHPDVEQVTVGYYPAAVVGGRKAGSRAHDCRGAV